MIKQSLRTEFAPAAVLSACAGLFATPKKLPAWLFYDETGSALFEAITELPEYYPTRVEHSILDKHADAMLRAAIDDKPFCIVELGAGTATKTELLLAAAVRHTRPVAAAPNAPVAYYPADVSEAPLAVAQQRLARSLPAVRVLPIVGTHEHAFRRLQGLPGRRLVLFLGSSIGNYDHADAIDLLRRLRAALHPGDALLLGTDLRKDPKILVRAYDDAAGVTARFNLNVLARLKREAGAQFDPSLFSHVAVWNERESRIEMHLESRVAQIVRIDALGTSITFHAGERIHTESSYKYDAAKVGWLLGAAGFRGEASYCDTRQWFAVHLARASVH